MSSDLRDLYQEVILDHYKRPRNFRVMDDGRKAEGNNPLCGDEITVYLKVVDGKVADVSIQGRGCAISTASASLMTESVKGKSLEEVQDLYEGFHHVVTGEGEPPAHGMDLGKLEVLAGVREFPVRVKCATLAWHTLRAGLAAREGTVSTE